MSGYQGGNPIPPPLDLSQILANQLNANQLLAALVQAVKAASIAGGYVVIGSGDFLNSGSILLGGTLDQQAAGSGLGNDGTTTYVANQTTIAATTGTTTVAPAEGVTDFLLNLGTVNTTIAIGTATHPGQSFWMDIKMGSSVVTAALGSAVTFGTTYPSFTMTPTAHARDRLHFSSVNPSTWALDALAQGFTV